MKRAHPMRPLIILVSIAAVLTLLGIALMYFGQRYLTTTVNEEFEELSFTSMDIAVFKGEVLIEHLEYNDDEVSVSAGTVTLTIDPEEVLDMVFGARELSVFTVLAENLEVEQEGLSVHFGALDLDVSGRVLLEHPEGSTVTHVRAQVENGFDVTAADELQVHSDRLIAEVYGEYRDFASLDSLQALLEHTQEFYLDAEGPELMLSEAVRNELALTVPLSTWLTDRESFIGENLSLSLEFLEDTVNVRKVSISFPILKADGSAVFSPVRPMQMRVDLTVSSLSDAIRDELNTILMIFFQQIPEGAFQFTLDTRNSQSPPLIQFIPR